MTFSSFSSLIVWNNTLEIWGQAVLILCGVYLAGKLFRRFFLKRVLVRWQQTNTALDLMTQSLLRIHPLYYRFGAVVAASLVLTLPPLGQKILTNLFIIATGVQALIAVKPLVDAAIWKFIIRKTPDTETQTTFNILDILCSIILWIVTVLTILSFLGFDITSLVASLGIGGIAIAFALQNILGDIFASFTLFFDKPFQVGDSINIGTEKGIVQKIGLKSTRLLTPQGDELVVSNKELTTTKLRNQTRLQDRKSTFQITLSFETPEEKIASIVPTIRTIIDQLPHASCERCHFITFGPYGYVLEAVLIVHSVDYTLFLETQESMNLQIVHALQKENITLARPFVLNK